MPGLYDTFPYDTLFYDSDGAVFIPSAETYELDRLRVIDFPYRGSRPRTVLDLNDGTTFALVRDTFKITPGEKQQQFSQLVKRYGGQKLVQETTNNGQVEAEWYISGADTATAFNTQEAFIALIERIAGTPRYIEWRPEGAANSVFFEVRAGLPWEPMYKWIETITTHTLHLKAAFSVAPLALGATMFINDDFSVDSIADYTQKAAGGGQLIGHVTISGGSMGANSSAVTGQTYLFEMSRDGYSYGDAEATTFHQVGATINGVKFGSYMKASYDTGGAGSHTYLRGYVDDDGVNSRLRIDKSVAGVTTNLVSVNLAARIATAAPFYVRFRVEGSKIYVEYYLAPTAAPDATTRTQGTSYQMNATEIGQFGQAVRGKAGIVMTFQNKTATVDKTYDFEIRPFTYRNNDATGAANVLLPDDDFKLANLYGTAPALCDVSLRQSSNANNPPVFGLIGWTPEPGAVNYVWNGDFENVNVNGWQDLPTGNNWPSVSGLIAAPSIALGPSSAVGTPGADYGVYAARFTAAAVANSGTQFPIYRRFKKGVTYTFAAWTYGTAVAMSLGLGVSADKTDIAFTGSAAWTLRTSTWTPTADRDIAYLYYRQTSAAGGGPHYIDGVQVYEGTTAPTRSTQTFGRGAQVPFGILDGLSRDTTQGEYLNITTDATARLGWRGTVGEWLVDPAALAADDFTEDEVQIEVWGRMYIGSANTSGTYILSCYPDGGTAYGTEQYTSEYGSSGKTVTTPTSVGYGWRMIRFGTLTFKIDANRPTRYRMKLGQTGSAGANLLDYLVCVPVLKRALSPTGKPNLAASYPRLFSTNSDILKVVHTSLWAEILRVTANGQESAFPDTGLGGSFIEVPTPNARACVKVSSIVPDDPTIDSRTEVLQHSFGVTFDVQPRYFLMRND